MRGPFAVFAFALSLFIAPSALAQEEGESMIEPRLAAVLVYADWCSSCKVLDPKLEAVKAAETFPTVKFVTLDYTARDADAFTAQAGEKGVGEAVTAHLNGNIKTGQLLLVDLDDKTVIGKVTKELTEAQITEALNTAAAAA